MLESFNSGKFEYKKLSLEEQKQRGILGRLVGCIADFKNPTRNGRRYSEALWDRVFQDKLMKERIDNRICVGELGHPSDRTEVDMEKIAICLAEQPKKGKDGKLYGVFDILSTPSGRILKSLCDYGCNIGISSRGEGDLITGYDGQEEVDPDTYECTCWDAVLIPAVAEARLQYVTESLDKTRYNKTLRQSLAESLEKANDEDRKVMQESLESLGINLNEAEEAEASEESIENIPENGGIDSEMPESVSEFTNRLPVIELGDGVYYYINLSNGKLQAGSTTNTGFISEIEIKYNPEDSFDENLQVLYDKILEENPDIMNNEDEAELPEDEEVLADDENDIQDESLNINEADDMAVENNEAIVEQLQELLKVNADLEQQVMSLQEKLSVSYAKEAKIEEEAEKYKSNVKTLAESAREAKALQTRITKLEERLTESKNSEAELNKKLTEARERINSHSEKAQVLKESISSKNTEVAQLNESVVNLKSLLSEAQGVIKETQNALTESKATHNKDVKINKQLKEKFEKEKSELNESIAQLQKDISLQKNETNQKLNNAKKLIEKYKKATATAVDKYIALQAVRLGSSVNEVKNRLPESYSFDDIDKVCEGLQSYNLNMSKLPFNALQKKSINENIKIKGTSSKNESILPVSGFDDDIDEDLLYLAGK